MQIVPAILTDNPFELKQLINVCEGKVERVSIDIVDGKFEEKATIDPSALNYIETNLRIDFQLMVEKPVNWIEKCLRAGGDRIIGHVEMMASQIEFLDRVHENHVSAGLALRVESGVAQIDSDIFSEIDVILLMGHKTGVGGLDFDPRVFDKIQELKELRASRGYKYKIQVDGGVKKENIVKLVQLEVDEVSIGRRIFNGNIEENLNEYRDIIMQDGE